MGENFIKCEYEHEFERIDKAKEKKEENIILKALFFETEKLSKLRKS
jgi:hypothetical protein